MNIISEKGGDEPRRWN